MPLGEWYNTFDYYRRIPLLKKMFWWYFLLLIFEGALRKWIFPEYSAPLLLVRDPLALLIIAEAYREDRMPQRWALFIGGMATFLIALCVIQVVTVDNPWMAAVYGLRSDLLPFPIALIMGENLDSDDLRRFARCTLWLMLPETALEIAQYLAPAGSILNAGAYQGGTQISYAGSHVRASGTFSFVVGPASFIPLAAVFLLYGMFEEGFIPIWLLWSAAVAAFVSIPIIGSRTLVVGVAAVIGCAAVASIFGASKFLKSLRILVPLLGVFLLASLLPIVSESSRTLHERVVGANEVEGKGSYHGAVLHRTLAPFTRRLEETDFSSNPVGYGMGRGAAAVTKLLQGRVQFIAGESEIDRAIYELGPFPGFGYTLLRFGLALTLMIRAFSHTRDGSPLAWLISPLMFSGVTLSVLEQPTEQGFMVIFIAFTLAALKIPGKTIQRATGVRSVVQPERYSNPIR